MALAGFALGLGLFAAAILAVLTGVLWRLLARRVPWLGVLVVIVGVVLVAGCFLPPTRERHVEALHGETTGTAWLPVVAGASARAAASGGNATLERLANGTWLRLDCPSGCSFQGGTRGDDPDASLGLDADRAADATAEGNLTLTSTLLDCVRMPVVVSLTLGGSSCAACYDAAYSFVGGRLSGQPGATC